jgi:hypothetical protein
MSGGKSSGKSSPREWWEQLGALEMLEVAVQPFPEVAALSWARRPLPGA